MNLYVMHQLIAATGIKPTDMAAWQGGNMLTIPYAIPLKGMGRRYSRANVYEVALFQAISHSGPRRRDTTALIRARLEFIRRSGLLSSVGSNKVFNTDERSMVMEFARPRDLENPIIYWLTKRQGAWTMITPHASSIGDLIAQDSANFGSVINASKLLSEVDAVLDGKPMADPFMARGWSDGE